MTASHNDVAATLKFSAENTPDFWSLSGIFANCLRQADIRLYRHDVAFGGRTMTFETDHGRIRIAMRESDRGAHALTIRTSAKLEGSREIARQICYQLSQRIMDRENAETVLWESTSQRFAPANFKWSGLDDMPPHVNKVMLRAGLSGQGISVA